MGVKLHIRSILAVVLAVVSVAAYLFLIDESLPEIHGNVIFVSIEDVYGTNPEWLAVDIGANSEQKIPVKSTWEFPTYLADENTMLFRVTDPLLANIDPGSFGFQVGSWGDLVPGDRKICESEAQTGRPRWLPSANGVLLAQDNDVVIFDPFNCSVIETLYTHESTCGEEMSSVSRPAISQQNLLAFEEWCKGLDASIVIIDLNKDEEIYEIEAATNPVWSPDGRSLSFVRSDGIYISDEEFSDIRRVFANPNDIDSNSLDEAWGTSRIPAPEWSPDGSKLIYHRPILDEEGTTKRIISYDIFALDLATGEETLLRRNGLYPYWFR